MDFGTYDTFMERVTPQYGKCTSLVGESAEPWMRNAIDLGIGTGNISEKLLSKNHNLKIIGVDKSKEALDAAKRKLNGSVKYIEGDFKEFDMGKPDLIVSGLAIHHLSHDDQKTLLGRIYSALNEKGVFVNYELVKRDGLSTIDFEELIPFWKSRGISDKEIEVYIREINKNDNPMQLSDHLTSIPNAEILFLNYPFCVYKCVKN